MAEAALGGVPIVAYDIDWHSEAAETGDRRASSYLDYSLMADSVEKILSDKEYSKSIRAKVRERMLKLMDPKINDKVLIDIYQKLLAPKRRQE